MSANRLPQAALPSQVANKISLVPEQRMQEGFAMFPAGVVIPGGLQPQPWQQELYRQAFEQARRDAEIAHRQRFHHTVYSGAVSEN